MTTTSTTSQVYIYFTSLFIKICFSTFVYLFLLPSPHLYSYTSVYLTETNEGLYYFVLLHIFDLFIHYKTSQGSN